MPESVSDSPVTEFYKNSKVFLTGGTGFLGKVIIEKLLRVCSVDHIYLLIRTKKEKDPQARMKEMFDVPLFSKIRETNPDFMKKITCIRGDVNGPNLNMSDTDYEFLINEITHVIHSAATVRFNEHLKSAIGINVIGTQEIVKFCNKCTRIKILVHVSTIYSNCNRKDVGEIFYEPSITPEQAVALTKCLPDEKIQSITPELIKPWFNTYAYTKAIAESVVRDNAKSYPTVVFRPSIVMGSVSEPVKGWVDNIYGPTGIIVGVGVGLLRTLMADPSAAANIVPVDYTVNALLCSAWEVGTSFDTSAKKSLTDSEDRKLQKKPKIYNYTVDKNNTINWSKFLKLCTDIGNNYPSERSVWYFSITITAIHFWGVILMFLLHQVPAAIIDTCFFVLGKKPLLRKAYQKIHTFLYLLREFATSSWDFEDQNTKNLWTHLNSKDKELYNFDMAHIDWPSFMEAVILGIRKYIFNESDSTLPAARRKYFFLTIAHRLLQFLLVVFIIWVLSKFFFLITDLKTNFPDSILKEANTIRNST